MFLNKESLKNNNKSLKSVFEGKTFYQNTTLHTLTNPNS